MQGSFAEPLLAEKLDELFVTLLLFYCTKQQCTHDSLMSTVKMDQEIFCCILQTNSFNLVFKESGVTISAWSAKVMSQRSKKSFFGVRKVICTQSPVFSSFTKP